MPNHLRKVKKKYLERKFSKLKHKIIKVDKHKQDKHHPLLNRHAELLNSNSCQKEHSSFIVRIIQIFPVIITHKSLLRVGRNPAIYFSKSVIQICWSKVKNIFLCSIQTSISIHFLKYPPPIIIGKGKESQHKLYGAYCSWRTL